MIFLENKKKKLTIVTEIDDISCLEQVNNGTYDAYVGPKAVANYLIKTKGLDQLEIVAETQYNYAPSLAVQKNNLILNQIIQKSTNSISDLEKRNIFNNWLYDAVVPFYKKTKFWIISTTIIVSVFCGYSSFKSLFKILDQKKKLKN